MHTLPAQEIKRRGIIAVVELLQTGNMHIIKNNEPPYVLSQKRYREPIEAQSDAYAVRVHASLHDVKAGRIKRGIPKDLVKELGLND